MKIKLEYDMKYREVAENYHLKIINKIQEGKRTHVYSALRKLESGEHRKPSTFTLPKHAGNGYTPFQS